MTDRTVTLRDSDDVVLSIAAQLVGALRTLEPAARAEAVRAYLAGDVVFGLSPAGLRVIPAGELPDPDYVPGYL